MKTSIDQLIINSPYEEPKHYWSYDRETRTILPKRRAHYLEGMAGDSKCEEEDMKLDQIGFWSEIKLAHTILGSSLDSLLNLDILYPLPLLLLNHPQKSVM